MLLPSFDFVGLKPPIIKCLEAYRDDELSERREKRRKLLDKNGDKQADPAVSASDTETLDGTAASNDQNNDARTSSMEVCFCVCEIL